MIYLVRHGQTQFNLGKRLQGSLDSPLTPLGEQQARQVGQLLRDLVPAGETLPFFSSPQPRALATSALIRAELGGDHPLRIDARLREFAMGCWEGLTTADVDRDWPGANATASSRLAWARHCPDGETLADARARLADWLRSEGERDAIVVSHGGAGSLLRGLYTGLSDEEALDLPIPQDAIFLLADGAIREVRAVMTLS